MSTSLRHPNYNIPVRVALLLMALRLALFFFNADFPGQEEGFVFLLLAALPILAIYAIWPRPGRPRGSLMRDSLAALRITLVYSALMVAFLYFYFTFADTDFFPNFQDRAISMELERNTDLSPEEITKRGREFFSKRNFTVLTIGAFLVMSAFYSFLFSILKRVFIRPVA